MIKQLAILPVLGILVAGCLTPKAEPLGATATTVMVDDNRSIVYPSAAFSNVSSALFTLNGQPLTSWTNCTVTNTLVSSNWSIWVATTNVDMGGFTLTNATAIFATTISATSLAADTAAIAALTTFTADSATITTNSFGMATMVTGTVSYLRGSGGVIKVKD